jgi:hypothetical protein
VSLRFVSAEERPDLAAQRGPLLAGWPEFMFHDPVAGECWDLLYERFPAFQHFLLDDETGEPIRLGGAIVKPCRRSMTIPGAVGDWESWTGMSFPESGDYVVPGALTLVAIDREADLGLYVEPNVWLHHGL